MAATVDSIPIRRQIALDFMMWLLLFLGLSAALVLRQQTLYSFREYVDPSAGIRLRYPTHWLLEHQDDSLFRAVDVANPRFETTFQIQRIPIRSFPEVTGHTVLYSRSIEYADALSNFRTLEFPTLSFGEFEELQGMAYTFVSSSSNPLIQPEVVVVRGLDIVVIRRGLAYVISYRAEISEYDQQLPFFRRFSESLRI
ncbi:MAG: hypothetical protein OXG02_00825 [Chloroflexi bacterium]|nr:hypothetical protein [Chloroflexota bacterium]